jgi:hypothetical protein
MQHRAFNRDVYKQPIIFKFTDIKSYFQLHSIASKGATTGGSGVQTPLFCLDSSKTVDTFFLWGSVCSIYHVFPVPHILQCYYNSVNSRDKSVTRWRRILCCRREKCNTTALRTKCRTSFTGFIMFSQRLRQCLKVTILVLEV